MSGICGIDEAGRGPLAGPVTAAAVVLNPLFPLKELKDSKQLGKNTRERIAAEILRQAFAFGIGWVWPEEIDEMNIHRASLRAMERAFFNLNTTTGQPAVCRVLVDGKFIPQLPVPCEAIVKGDATVPEIMAASILAKTARDRWMIRYSWLDPRYGFESHKGYPTKEHRECCRIYGLSPIHRRSFAIFPRSI